MHFQAQRDLAAKVAMMEWQPMSWCAGKAHNTAAASYARQRKIMNITHSIERKLLERNAPDNRQDTQPKREAPAVQAVQAVPSGWKLVPVEPTDEMLKNAVMERHGSATYRAVSRKGCEALEEEAKADWAAMLAAAPAAPAQEPSADALDAKRYRKLKTLDWYVGPFSFYCDEGGGLQNCDNHNNSGLDAAIDAAIAAQEGARK